MGVCNMRAYTTAKRNEKEKYHAYAANAPHYGEVHEKHLYEYESFRGGIKVLGGFFIFVLVLAIIAYIL